MYLHADGMRFWRMLSEWRHIQREASVLSVLQYRAIPGPQKAEWADKYWPCAFLFSELYADEKGPEAQRKPFG